MRLVVPFTPGGGSDIVARAIGNKLGDVLRRQVVVDNRPGGGITIGSDLVAKSAPDGNTVLIVTIAHAVNPSLHKTLPYDTEKDFSPISLVTTAQRSRFFPELPTIAEAGPPGYELVSWQGILAPGKTPREIVNHLNAAIVTVLNMPDLKEYLAGRGYDATGSTAERFAGFISSEIQRWGKLVKSIGARVD
ncbi:MAG: hypothetical protein HYY79_10485 [Betaproteobacteria bacterium]|nr:hypothetical protein [Betaproteobacteria bacterium]